MSRPLLAVRRSRRWRCGHRTCGWRGNSASELPDGSTGCAHELARRSPSTGRILQPSQAVLVVAADPGRQCLPVHPDPFGRLGPALAVQHQGQHQHPPRRSGVLAARHRRTQTRRVQLIPPDRDRRVQPRKHADSELDGAEPHQIQRESLIGRVVSRTGLAGRPHAKQPPYLPALTPGLSHLECPAVGRRACRPSTPNE